MQKLITKMSSISKKSWITLSLVSSLATANPEFNLLSGFDPDCLYSVAKFEICVKRGDLSDYSPEQTNKFGEIAQYLDRKTERERNAQKTFCQKHWLTNCNFEIVSQSLCTEDSLTLDQALGRLQWVKKCLPTYLDSPTRAKIERLENMARPLYPIFSKKNGPQFGQTIPMPIDPKASCEAMQPEIFIKGFCG